MQDKILQTLAALEQPQRMRILFACESGSRAWHCASADSDYDVRFIYVRPLPHYLSIGQHPDTFSQPVSDRLDLHGWDVRKALALLRSSNPSLLEWLHSSVVYRADEPWLTACRALAAQSFRPRPLFHHYLAMAHNNRQTSADWTAKRYLYVLRPLLCAWWLVHYQRMPPLAVDALCDGLPLDTSQRESMATLLCARRGATEQQPVQRYPILDALIATLTIRLPEQPPAIRPPADMALFDEFLLHTVVPPLQPA
ncbi:nucleotidyltransferase domain-containing protein [Pokkaliibacter sp. MBI-7]|uniref:nucleotidyltransferase domain-containing protein n=1 Tax=Pokkaliibacter sp. MBI-7 TaxID=3040600 RepID=UPI00244AFA59|nr:nucleotidyltransferase domain-containing protein [Pokkaliibacter sp. MBI-7]MDH2431435.1 nucleotidyltransferase domain-containing protein [Pokkaliibacter sp. MBI-7]